MDVSESTEKKFALPPCVSDLIEPSKNWVTPTHFGEGGSSLLGLLIPTLVSSRDLSQSTSRNMSSLQEVQGKYVSWKNYT